MSLTAEGRRRRARAAALRRHHPDKPELAADDQRALKVDRAEKLVRELVDTFPPLTADQRGRLALLLQGGGGDAARQAKRPQRAASTRRRQANEQQDRTPSSGR